MEGIPESKSSKLSYKNCIWLGLGRVNDQVNIKRYITFVTLERGWHLSFTQLVKVRGGNLVLALPSIQLTWNFSCSQVVSKSHLGKVNVLFSPIICDLPDEARVVHLCREKIYNQIYSNLQSNIFKYTGIYFFVAEKVRDFQIAI